MFKKMKKGSIILVIVALTIFIAVFTAISSKKKDKEQIYTFAKVTNTDIRNLVSSTGTLETKGLIEVGTQVSGTVSKVFADYNDNVKKGQLLAILDVTLLEITLEQCEADFAKSKSQYELALTDYKNKEDLFKENLISKYEFDTAKVSKEVAYSQYLSSFANQKRAKANLEYAYIRSPIDGTVIAKSIEEGQTVAASFSSPTLFTIAEDLSSMQINALVDESDISLIKNNQKVIFTVEAYSDIEFNGIVREIRLNPTVVSNVVNYAVIIDTINEKRLLLPGMTATIDFIISEKKNVYAIPNSVLKYRPDDEIIKEFMGKQTKKNPTKNDLKFVDKERKFSEKIEKSKNFGINSSIGDKFHEKKDENFMKDKALLWYLDKNKEIRPLKIKLGLSDDINTEIIGAGEDVLNLEIICGKSKTDKSSSISKSIKNKTNNKKFQKGSPPPFF